MLPGWLCPGALDAALCRASTVLGAALAPRDPLPGPITGLCFLQVPKGAGSPQGREPRNLIYLIFLLETARFSGNPRERCILCPLFLVFS